MEKLNVCIIEILDAQIDFKEGTDDYPKYQNLSELVGVT